MHKALETTFFRDTLSNGDVRAVRRALEHMITWHEIYGVEMSVEYGIEANGDGVIYPCSELYATGMENQPGVVIHQRKVTGWEPKSRFPAPELYQGQQVDIAAATEFGPPDFVPTHETR